MSDGRLDIHGEAYLAWMNKDDEGFYLLQEQQECNLCRPWHKSMPGSDERILAIESDGDFVRTATANRSPKDARALWQERCRRERERRLAGRK